MLGKISEDNILKYFFLFFPETDFDISCKLSPMETICMKCQILVSGKNKKNINLLFAELAQRVVKVINDKWMTDWQSNIDVIVTTSN